MSTANEHGFPGYEVESEIGRSALGVVYKATDVRLGRKVALREPSPSISQDRDRLAVCLEESRAVRLLDHPSFVSIYDVVENRGHPFLVMEHIEGPSLRDLIEERRFVPFSRKIDMIRLVCEGLAVLHRTGKCHGNIRPESLRLDAGGQVRILGLESASWPGETRKSTDYAPPEGVDFSSGCRADLYAAAVVLHELLTFQPPFGAEKANGTRDVEPASFLSNGSQDLIETLRTALAPEAGSRFLDGEDFARALIRLNEDLPAELEKLRSKVSSLHSDLDLRWQEAAQMGEIPAYFDAPFFRLEPPEGDVDDYGSLLRLLVGLQEKHSRVEERRPQAIRIHALLSQGSEQIVRDEFDSCRETVDQILEIHPDDELAAGLLERCGDATSRLEEDSIRADLSLSAADWAFLKGDDAVCRKALERVLELQPGNPEAVDLGVRLQARRQETFQSLLERAQLQEKEGEYDACLSFIDEARQILPGFDELESYEETIRAKVESFHQENEDLFRKARLQFEGGDYQEAGATLAELLSRDSDHRNALQLQVEVDRLQGLDRKVESLLEQARARAAASDYGACLKAAEEGLEMAAGHQGFQSLRREASAGLDAARLRLDESLDVLVEYSRDQLQRGLRERASSNAAFVRRVVPEDSRLDDLLGEMQGDARLEVLASSEAAHPVEGWQQVGSQARTQPPVIDWKLWSGRIRVAGAALERSARQTASVLNRSFRELRDRWPEVMAALRRPSSQSPHPESAPLAEGPPGDVATGPGFTAPRLANLRKVTVPKMWRPLQKVTVPKMWRPYIAMAAALAVVSVAIPFWPDDVALWTDDVAAPQKPAPIPPAPTGLVGLDSVPWARVDSVVRAENGQVVKDATCTTPCWIALPAGEYSVRFSNPEFPEYGRSDTTIRVSAGTRERFHLRLPGFEPEREIEKEVSKLRDEK